jgi:hypothetical protein
MGAWAGREFGVALTPKKDGPERGSRSIVDGSTGDADAAQ